jgi:hypothetical protein
MSNLYRFGEDAASSTPTNQPMPDSPVSILAVAESDVFDLLAPVVTPRVSHTTRDDGTTYGPSSQRSYASNSNYQLQDLLPTVCDQILSLSIPHTPKSALLNTEFRLMSHDQASQVFSPRFGQFLLMFPQHFPPRELQPSLCVEKAQTNESIRGTHEVNTSPSHQLHTHERHSPTYLAVSMDYFMILAGSTDSNRKPLMRHVAREATTLFPVNCLMSRARHTSRTVLR